MTWLPPNRGDRPNGGHSPHNSRLAPVCLFGTEVHFSHCYERDEWQLAQQERGERLGLISLPSNVGKHVGVYEECFSWHRSQLEGR